MATKRDSRMPADAAVISTTPNLRTTLMPVVTGIVLHERTTRLAQVAIQRGFMMPSITATSEHYSGCLHQHPAPDKTAAERLRFC